MRETVNHNCCHVCRRVKKSEFEFTFLYFKVYYQKSTPLAILLTIEFLINIRSQNLTYSLYLSLMTLRTSLTSAASNVKSCHILPPLEHHLSESQNGISLLTLRTVPKLLLTGMLNPICSQNLTYGLYLSLMTLRTSLTSAASNVKSCHILPPLEHHLSESQNGISLLTLRTVPKLLLTGMLNPICSQNLTYGLYLSLMTLRTSLTSVASNVELCQELPLWSILLWDLEEV